jgi:5'-3' exonuclease/transcription antitermination factor NusG
MPNLETWVVLELSPKAEGEDPDIVSRSIRSVVRGAEVFVPAMVTQIGGNRVIHYLVEGYAFIKRERLDDVYLKLANTRYVQSVLVIGSGAKKYSSLATIPSSEISRMRAQMKVEVDQGIEVGDSVKIISGPYREIVAQVIEDISELQQVQVQIKLRSKEAILTFPRSFLQLVSKNPWKVRRNTTSAIRRWFAYASTLATWGSELSFSVSSKFAVWKHCFGFDTRYTGAFDFVEACAKKFRKKELARLESDWGKQDSLCYRAKMAFGSLELASTPLVESKKVDSFSKLWAKLDQLADKHSALQGYFRTTFLVLAPHNTILKYCAWLEPADLQDRSKRLFGFIQAMHQELNDKPVKKKFSAWSKAEKQSGKYVKLSDEVQSLERQLYLAENSLLDNILVDGFNLAFRCRYAPGLSDLKDSEGRPTGLVYGFLRSLGALKKRFPEAVLWVCWDGSNQRRKGLFAGYKANRVGRAPLEEGQQESSEDTQINFLRNLLPIIGVNQGWNPDEEADDVIASLVKGELVGQRNLVYSTDRDLLQLVDFQTICLTPGSGGSKEILFDIDKVVAEYGVEPSRLPHLRAFLGDTSDNIPGVASVPRKMVAGLVRSYSTVDGVYKSGLAGITSNQYKKFREAEEQVKLNVTLMTSVTIPVTKIESKLDRASAEESLKNIGANPDMIEVFFGATKGFMKTGESL